MPHPVDWSHSARLLKLVLKFGSRRETLIKNAISYRCDITTAATYQKRKTVKKLYILHLCEYKHINQCAKETQRLTVNVLFCNNAEVEIDVTVASSAEHSGNVLDNIDVVHGLTEVSVVPCLALTEK